MHKPVIIKLLLLHYIAVYFFQSYAHTTIVIKHSKEELINLSPLAGSIHLNQTDLNCPEEKQQILITDLKQSFPSYNSCF